VSIQDEYWFWPIRVLAGLLDEIGDNPTLAQRQLVRDYWQRVVTEFGLEGAEEKAEYWRRGLMDQLRAFLGEAK
jgi:hypothetical protein